MTCEIEFNKFTTCMIVFQNKCTHVITPFACYITNKIPLIYYKISTIYVSKTTPPPFLLSTKYVALIQSNTISTFFSFPHPK